jgi:hypothetical protein
MTVMARYVHMNTVMERWVRTCRAAKTVCAFWTTGATTPGRVADAWYRASRSPQGSDWGVALPSAAGLSC